MSITSGAAEINGVNLYYEDAGTGPPLVLLHDGLADVLESGIPDAEKVTMPGVGHMLNLEMPEEFNRLALDLLSRTWRGRAKRIT